MIIMLRDFLKEDILDNFYSEIDDKNEKTQIKIKDFKDKRVSKLLLGSLLLSTQIFGIICEFYSYHIENGIENSIAASYVIFSLVITYKNLDNFKIHNFLIFLDIIFFSCIPIYRI